MAIQSPDLKFKVSNSIQDTTKLISEQNYYAQKQSTPAQLTRKLIYYLGKQNPLDFPLATKLMGGGYFNTSNMQKMEDNTVDNPFHINTTMKVIDTTEFTYPVMTSFRNGSEVATTLTGSSNGIGQSEFTLVFKTNALHKSYIIQSPRKVQLYVVDMKSVGGLFYYTVKIPTGVMAQVCPASETVAGTIWINMFPVIAESGSRNIDIARMVTPSAYKNQITKMRTGLSWEGESANKKSKIIVFKDAKNPEVDLKGGTEGGAYWMDQYTYNYEIDNLTLVESLLWYSEYNRNANGTISLKDNFTGKPIAIGAGILSQILNKVSYNKFSHKFLSDLIGRQFYGIKGTPREKTLYTGTLGFRIFDAAMKRAGVEFLKPNGWNGVADKFVTGSSDSLMLGGYFDGFYHVDGWIIKVKKTNIFNNSLITNSPIDEESGLPCESGRMILLDDSDYEGESNIQLILGDGFTPYKHAVLRGFNDVPPSISIMGGNNMLDDKSSLGVVGSDEEKSSYMRMYKMGVQLLRGNTSFDLQYTPYNLY